MGAPRTILHVINTTGPGGAETVFANIARGLDTARWRSIAVVLDRGWLETELTTAGVRTFILPDRGISALPRYVLELHHLVSSFRVDLVHAHLFGPAYTASLLGAVRGVPVVATIHGVPDFSNERLLSLKLQLLRGASSIVFVSESLRETFLAGSHLTDTRTDVIVNGVDPHLFSPAPFDDPRDTDPISTDHFVVGAIGNIRDAKGYDVLLRAAALLKERYDGYRFVIAGDGTDTPLGQELFRLRDSLGLATLVEFTGFRPDVRPLLSSFDVYALTSRTEGFSISTVEAMALGIPVVATRCGGPEHILEHGVTGLLVQNGSPDAIAHAIDSLRLDRFSRVRLARRARASASTQFSLDAQVAAYERLYEECIATSSTASSRWFFNRSAVASGAAANRG